MAICPTGAIEISGRKILPADKIDLAEMKNKPSFEQLKNLMIGSIHPMIRNGAKKLKKKLNLSAKSPSGIVVIFGYPKYKFASGIRRSFAEVVIVPN